jgi:hypothetical protein
MKTLQKMMIFAAMAIFVSGQIFAYPLLDGEDEQADTTRYNVYTGKVVDALDKTPLPFATIESEGKNIATVTNIDGEFTIKVPVEVQVKNIKISYVGYKNSVLDVEAYKNKRNKVIQLQPSSVNLAEITIRSEDAEGLIHEILTNIRENYSSVDMMMTGFYRETIRKKRNYVSIAEAVVDIYKSPYENDFRYDQVKLIQGRKSADVEKMDTVLFKVQGGPVTALMLDVAKNPYLLLSDEYQAVYTFVISGVISINDRLHYVISFNQNPHVTTPYYNGKLFVDMDKLAITEAEFALNLENQMEAASMFIRKKPFGMSVIPDGAVYRTKYTIEDNKWYFSYARAEVKFDVDWDKRLFNTSYSTMSEIAITDRSDLLAEKFANKDRFKRSQVLDDLVYVFFDQDFWGSYNVIEPDQSIESAIKRLNRKFLKNSDNNAKP